MSVGAPTDTEARVLDVLDAHAQECITSARIVLAGQEHTRAAYERFCQRWAQPDSPTLATLARAHEAGLNVATQHARPVDTIDAATLRWLSAAGLVTRDAWTRATARWRPTVRDEQ